MDHTLWDFEKNSELAFARIFDAKYPHIQIADFIGVYIPINKACWQLYQVDQMTHDALRYQRLKQSFDALAVEISDDEINQMAPRFLKAIEILQEKIPDIIPVLPIANGMQTYLEKQSISWSGD